MRGLIVRGIDVQDQLPGWVFERRDALIGQDFVDPPGRFQIGPILSATLGRRVGTLPPIGQCGGHRGA